MPKLAFPYNQIDGYLNCYHRTFNQQLLEADTEIYSEALGGAPRDQSERGRSDNISKGVKTMMVILTERADLS